MASRSSMRPISSRRSKRSSWCWRLTNAQPPMAMSAATMAAHDHPARLGRARADLLDGAIILFAERHAATERRTAERRGRALHGQQGVGRRLPRQRRRASAAAPNGSSDASTSSGAGGTGGRLSSISRPSSSTSSDSGMGGGTGGMSWLMAAQRYRSVMRASTVAKEPAAIARDGFSMFDDAARGASVYVRAWAV
jgi:hypothetical protein